MYKKIRERIRKESFLTTPLAIIVNPFYIIRRGLYLTILEFSKKIYGQRILDFGCGSKPYKNLFSKADLYIGIDIENSGHYHGDSKVDVYYNGKDIPFPDNSFDAIVCFEVLEHVFNIDEVLKELWRVVKPKGQLLISIPFAWDEHETPYDFARYTSFGITYLLEKNGFKVISQKKTTTYYLALCQLRIAYLVQHVLPNGRFLGNLSQLLIVLPLTLSALLLDKFYPKRYDYFCNSVVLSIKEFSK